MLGGRENSKKNVKNGEKLKKKPQTHVLMGKNCVESEYDIIFARFLPSRHLIFEISKNLKNSEVARWMTQKNYAAIRFPTTKNPQIQKISANNNNRHLGLQKFQKFSKFRGT